MADVEQIVKKISVAVGLSLSFQATAADSYSVDQYVEEVLKASLSLKAKTVELEATELEEKKADLNYATPLNSTLAHTVDKRPSESLAPSYTGMSAGSWEVDFTKQFSTGTRARAGVEFQRSTLYGFTPGLVPLPPEDRTGFRSRPFLEVSQSLWQDAFGRTARLTERLLKIQTSAQRSDVEARKATLTAEAKLAYARLAFARTRKFYTNKSLETARQIYRLIENKYRRNLSEKSDLLQAEALLTARMLEHSGSIDEENTSTVAFNHKLLLRDVKTTKNIEPLETLHFLAKDKTDFNVEKRQELETLRRHLEAVKVGVETAEDKARPTLDVFAQYGLNGSKETFQESVSKLNDPYEPTYTVGLKLSLFLDRKLMESQVSVARLRFAAAELQYQEAFESLQRDLATLIAKRSLARERVKTASDMESVQTTKLAHEKTQYGNGRSTTYQLLMFTQDLSNAELGRLQAFYELILTDIQLSLFQ